MRLWNTPHLWGKWGKKEKRTNWNFEREKERVHETKLHQNHVPVFYSVRFSKDYFIEYIFEML